VQRLLCGAAVLVTFIKPKFSDTEDVLMGKLTYKSFISNVMILLFSLIWTLFSSCAISCEFLVVYVFGKHIKLRNFLLRNLATLYDGSCVLSRVESVHPSCAFLCT
jgi:hypothetical protein